MKANELILAVAMLAIALASPCRTAAQTTTVGSGKIKHVMLLSIDGMYAADFYNCAHGIAGANGGNPYCPNMAALSQTAINYVAVWSSRPSDSFPGMAALASGGTPKSATSRSGRLIYSSCCDLPFRTSESRGLAVAWRWRCERWR
jgi:hypothetical protein